MFSHWYDLDVIEEDAFLKWKEDISHNFPGKGKALFQVNSVIGCFVVFIGVMTDIVSTVCQDFLSDQSLTNFVENPVSQIIIFLIIKDSHKLSK